MAGPSGIPPASLRWLPRCAGPAAVGPGMQVTKRLSGAGRATIDATRTLFVWIFSVAIGWEGFHSLQVGCSPFTSGSACILYRSRAHAVMPACSSCQA